MSERPDPIALWMLGEDVVCGNCVVWNGVRAHTETAGCAILGERHRDDQPCRRWFGLDQLRAPLYGRPVK